MLFVIDEVSKLVAGRTVLAKRFTGEDEGPEMLGVVIVIKRKTLGRRLIVRDPTAQKCLLGAAGKSADTWKGTSRIRPEPAGRINTELGQGAGPSIGGGPVVLDDRSDNRRVEETDQRREDASKSEKIILGRLGPLRPRSGSRAGGRRGRH